MLHPALIRRRRGRGNPLAGYIRNGFTPGAVADFEAGKYLGTLSSYADLTETGSPTFTEVHGKTCLELTVNTDAITLPAALFPEITDGMTVVVKAWATYTDNDTGHSANGGGGEISLAAAVSGPADYAELLVNTSAGRTGQPFARAEGGGVTMESGCASQTWLAPGTLVPINVAGTFKDGAVQVAVDGRAGTEDTGAGDLSTAFTADMVFGGFGGAAHTIFLRRIEVLARSSAKRGSRRHRRGTMCM